MNEVAPSREFRNNALVTLGNLKPTSRVQNVQSVWPKPQWLSFANAAAAGLNPDGTLTENSPLRRAATDGTDIGVDFAGLAIAIGLSVPTGSK